MPQFIIIQIVGAGKSKVVTKKFVANYPTAMAMVRKDAINRIYVQGHDNCSMLAEIQPAA